MTRKVGDVLFVARGEPAGVFDRIEDRSMRLRARWRNGTEARFPPAGTHRRDIRRCPGGFNAAAQQSASSALSASTAAI